MLWLSFHPNLVHILTISRKSAKENANLCVFPSTTVTANSRIWELVFLILQSGAIKLKLQTKTVREEGTMRWYNWSKLCGKHDGNLAFYVCFVPWFEEGYSLLTEIGNAHKKRWMETHFISKEFHILGDIKWLQVDRSELLFAVGAVVLVWSLVLMWRAAVWCRAAPPWPLLSPCGLQPCGGRT